MSTKNIHVYTQFIGRNVLGVRHWFGIELFDLNIFDASNLNIKCSCWMMIT